MYLYSFVCVLKDKIEYFYPLFFLMNCHCRSGSSFFGSSSNARKKMRKELSKIWLGYVRFDEV